MKKILSFALLALFACAIPLSFVGCKSTASKIVGTWVYSKTKVFYSSTYIREEVKNEDYGTVIEKIVFHKNKTADVYWSEKGGRYKDDDNYYWAIGKDNKILLYHIDEYNYAYTDMYKIENGKLIRGYKSEKDNGRGYQEIYIKK